MAEYIERGTAMEITTRTCGDYAAAFAEIRKLPASDVAPVVHGEWLLRHEGFIGGWTSNSANFVIDNKEYVLNLEEDKRWSEVN